MAYTAATLMLSVIMMSVFFTTSKMKETNYLSSSSFECGFTSYFFSRFSFSIHYFVTGLIFLFLDLEICITFFFFFYETVTVTTSFKVVLFVIYLLTCLLCEIWEYKISWMD